MSLPAFRPRALAALRRATAATRSRRLHSHAPASASLSVSSSAASSSSSSHGKLLAALLLGGGGALLSSQMLASTSVEAAPATANSSSSPPSPPRNLSDLLSIDYRTIGVAECPPLPSHAPRWLHELATDPQFQYRNLGAVLDTTNHLLYDGLKGENRLSEVYMFCEKADHTLVPNVPDAAAAGSEKKSANKQVVEAQSADKSPAAASASPSSPPSPPVTTGAFSVFTTDPPLQIVNTGPEVRAVFHVGPQLCGHRGIVHGGMTAALMDDISGAATFCAAGGGHFTANLNINYCKPLRAGQYVLVRAQAVKQQGRKTYVNISVEDGKGTVFANGTALYVKPKMLPPAVMLAATQ